MYKLLFHFILFFSLSLPAVAQENEGIQFFHGTWEEGLQKARQENKFGFRGWIYGLVRSLRQHDEKRISAKRGR